VKAAGFGGAIKNMDYAYEEISIFCDLTRASSRTYFDLDFAAFQKEMR